MISGKALRALACMIATFGTAAAATPRDFATYRPLAHATAVSAAEAPAIDGDLSDPAWARAQPIEEFFQVQPNEGTPASERTVVRILHDEENLYFAIHAYDRGAITARLKQRDAELYNDDAIRIYLDPNMTRRNAFTFQVNPLGARREGLLQNNLTTLYEWNAIWTARTRITPEGWTAEIAIPFRSISYDSRAEWGFDIDREIRRRNEGDRWSSINKAITANDISRSGTLDGMDGIRGAGGLDIQAFALTRYRKNWDNDHDTGVSFRPSGNLFYKLTPSLTGTLTYNTDFSDAPLDQRQVNTSRYSLFYPERRDFFLQDAASFEFGGRALNASDDPNGAPFFSRRIGIVNDVPVNILGGAKLSGEYEGIGIGALSVHTAGGAGVGEQTLSVGRVTLPVFDESKLGFVVTNGNPTGQSSNTVAGADFQFRRSNLFGNKRLNADVFYQRSFDGVQGEDDSFGFLMDFPNEPFNSLLMFKQVGERFDPALGFVSRPGSRIYQNVSKYRVHFEDAYLRWAELGVWAWMDYDLKNRPNSRVTGAYLCGYTDDGDYAQIEGKFDNEVVRTPFNLPHAIPVDAENYSFGILHTRLETAPGRLISMVFDLEYSGFFGGRRLQTDTTISLNPNETYSFSLHHVMQDISVAHGNVTVHVPSVDMSMNFTPDMQLRGQLQYDNISKAMQLSLRYRWEFEPGSELLVVAGDDATFSSPYYRSHNSIFSVRLGKTFRL